MNVFLCWSGELSKSVAQLFFDYLEDSPLPIDVKFSSEGIASGERWPSWLSESLEQSHYGWLFMTKENLESRWIHFEAGNLGKDSNQSRVCPILIDIEESELKPPLAHFQFRLLDRKGIFKAITDLNNALGKISVREAVLQRTFDSYWKKLSQSINQAIERYPVGEDQPKRSDREILIELLTETRRKSKRQDLAAHGSLSPGSIDEYIIGRISDRERSDYWRTVAANIQKYTTSDGLEFKVGDLVYHEANRDGVIAAIDSELGGALVLFNNSTTALPEPLFIEFDELKHRKE